MKIKVIVVALAVVIAALLIALFATKKSSAEQHAADVSSLNDLSNQVVSVTLKYNDANQVNLVLSNSLDMNQQQLAQLSNSLASANAALAETKVTLADAQQQVTSLNTHISDLETQNKALDQRAVEMTNALVQLNELIADTQAKLATAQTNNAYLQVELQKQMAAKAEIEHRFNDLDALRTQVSKVKTDLFVARRMQLMKNDLGGKKGAALLLTPNRPAPTATASAQPNYGLNVEVGSDGSVRVIPPISSTNAPAK
jgi:chromosome segregation ATPase